MLCGKPAFGGINAAEIMEENECNDISFTHIKYNISSEAQDFILELCNSNPNYRPTANEALKNIWFKKFLPRSPLEMYQFTSQTKLTLESGSSLHLKQVLQEKIKNEQTTEKCVIKCKKLPKKNSEESKNLEASVGTPQTRDSNFNALEDTIVENIVKMRTMKKKLKRKAEPVLGTLC